MKEKIRIALANNSAVNPCSFDSPPCRSPGMIAEQAIFIMKLLVIPDDGRNIVWDDFLFIPGNGYGFGSEESLLTEKKTNSVMGLVYQGLADFTEPDMYITSARANMGFRFIGTTMNTGQVWVYRPETSSRPNLGINELPIGAYSLILATAIAFTILRTALQRLYNSPYIEKFMVGNKVFLLILYGVFLKLVGSHFVLLFGQFSAKVRTFRNSYDVLDILETGEYKSVAVRNANYMSYILNPVDREGAEFRRMVEIYKKNPSTIVDSFEEGMALVLRPPDKGKYIYVDWDGYVPMFRSRYCGPQFARDDIFGTFSTTAFYSNTTKIKFKELTETERNMYDKVTLLLEKKYYPSKICTSEDVEVIPADTGGVQELKLSQVQMIFWLYILVIGVCTGILFIEILLGFIESRRKVRAYLDRKAKLLVKLKTRAVLVGWTKNRTKTTTVSQLGSYDLRKQSHDEKEKN